MSESVQKKRNWPFIIGVLFICVGMQFANYGSALCVSGDLTKLGATQFYVLISSLGTMGMMLVLPVLGKLTAILGQRTTILLGVFIQLLGRVIMMIAPAWPLYAVGQLVQSIGGGFYISAAYVLMPLAVDRSEMARFFGYIAVANALGSMCGPLVVSSVYAMGGIWSKLALILNLPLVAIGLLLVMKDCPNQRNADAAKGYDLPGLLLTVFGIACLVFCLNLSGKMFAWGSVPCLALAAVAIICIAVMIKRELTIANPAVPLKMFKNDRLTYAFICAAVASAYSTCSASYCAMWIRTNFQGLPASVFFTGTGTLAQGLVTFILGLFLGAYVGKKFAIRFRTFGIMSMVTAMIATGLLYCLKFTGTVAGGDLVLLANGTIPAGMILIYIATAIGGFTSSVAQGLYSAYWQSNMPREDIATGSALYNFGNTGGSVIFSAVVGVVLGSSGDFTRAFATGFVFACIGLLVAIKGFRFTQEEIDACNKAE
ncbi:MAG: MFS transporter [Eubacteriaceae bacterium]|nr:MFS transporter [Eubacteriaceae bacterium]